MPYVCYLCDYQSKYKSNLRAHMKSHTGEIPDTYQSYDRRSTTAAADLRSHMMSTFEDKPYEYGQCDFRGKRVGEFGAMTHSREKLHNRGSCDYDTSIAGNFRANMKTHTSEKEYACEVCDYMCNRGSLLKAHMRTHTGENAYRSCLFRGSGTASSVARMRTHTDEKRSCGICDCRSSSSSHFKRHMTTLMRRLMKRHTAEKSYTCELCDYRSNGTENLSTLMTSHHGRKPHACGPCDSRCITAGGLRTHTAENPYASGLCDYRCSQAVCSSMHMRKHSGEKPHARELCDYKSIGSSCGSCDYMCIRGGDTKRNMMTRSGDKPYGQLRTRVRAHKGKKPSPYGFYDYVWTQAGNMNTHPMSHTEDALPYAVVLVTGDPHW